MRWYRYAYRNAEVRGGINELQMVSVVFPTSDDTAAINHINARNESLEVSPMDPILEEGHANVERNRVVEFIPERKVECRWSEFSLAHGYRLEPVCS